MKNFIQNLFFVALLLFGSTIYAQDSSDDDSMDLEELEEIVLIGGGVIDLAEDRVTPLHLLRLNQRKFRKKLVILILRTFFKYSFCLCFFPGKRFW